MCLKHGNLAGFYTPGRTCRISESFPVNLNFLCFSVVLLLPRSSLLLFPTPACGRPDCPGIFRGSTVRVASCEGETLRTLHTKGPQLAGNVLPWQPWSGNTSQAICWELGRDCSFGNLPPRQLLAGRPLCELEHQPPEKGSEVRLGVTC